MSLTKEYSPTGVGTEREYDERESAFCPDLCGTQTGDRYYVAPIRKEIDQWDLMRELNNFDTQYGRQALLEQIFQFLGAK